MSGLGQWLLAVRRRPVVVDAALAAALYGATLLLTGVAPGGGLRASLVLSAAIAFGALVWRRRWPVPSLGAAAAGAILSVSLTNGQISLVLAAPMVALYTVAESAAGWRSLALGALVVAALTAVHMIIRPVAWFAPEVLTVVALGGLAVAAGNASRSRRARLAEVEDRASRAERNREEEARRRVIEERLRIARDLHDMLGHHIALINVEAGVADQVLEDHPLQAREALARIRQASRAGLDELRDTIGLLRQPGETAAPTEPTLGLSGLPDLVAALGRSGLHVDQEVEGDPRPVPPAADLTAYRVIQESLTNVRKHAGGARPSVRLCFGPAYLGVVVEDDGGGGPQVPANGTGHGIRGMRERVAAIGGTLEAGPRPGGGFRVEASLPLGRT